MDQQELFFICLFGVVGAIGYGVAKLFTGQASKIEQRLREKPAEQKISRPLTTRPQPSVINKIGQAAAKPFAPKTQDKQSTLRRKLGYAGITSRAAGTAYLGFKFIFLFAGVGLGYVLGLLLGDDLIGILLGGLFGFFLPSIWLRLRINRNHKALARGLPDALDLLVVCVEAGLTMESSMQRVGREITLAHPCLARELSIAHMETNMGVPRGEALRNLAVRTGSSELKSLTAMLVQAEKLGTSIGRALRVHAESLRLKRHYAAQEMAAKASVKLIFPVAMLIFPAVIVVLVGPAIVQMVESGFFNKQ